MLKICLKRRRLEGAQEEVAQKDQLPLHNTCDVERRNVQILVLTLDYADFVFLNHRAESERFPRHF